MFLGRIRLGTLLVAFQLGIVAIALVCVGSAGVRLLRRLAEDRAVAQVRLAGESALLAIERGEERRLTSARLLAERPTLARFLHEGDEASLREFLETYRNTSQLTGCATEFEGRLVATSPGAVPWSAIRETAKPGEGRFLLPRSPNGSLVMGAWAAVPGLAGARVIVALDVDDGYSERTGVKVGFPVAILAREEVDRLSSGARKDLLQRALDGENTIAERLDPPGAFLCAVPLRNTTGEAVGVVEATLPAKSVDASIRNLTNTLLVLTCLVGVVATGFALFLARRIARPIESLTEASARIGRGDFSSPVPHAFGPEVSTLARTMEEMRDRVLHLTTELRRRRAEAEAILTGIVEGVFAVDRERRIRYMNPQTAHLLGIEAETVIGRFCGDVLRPQGRDGVLPCEQSCPILHARFRGSARATERLMMEDGTRRAVVITSSPTESAGGADDEAHQFQVIRDETEEEATRRLRDAVLSNISHEFRTPLSAQLASLELLRDRLPELEPGELRELVLSIERGTLRLTRLIDNLLESTRIEAGQDSLRRQEVSLEEVIEEAVELTAPLIEQREQLLDTNLPFPLPTIQGDAPRLVQVFVNLLANANKFAPPGSRIGIGGRVGDSEVRLWVEDEGPGIPAGAVDSLFQRFHRAHGEEPEAGGMGLGLYIVKSIVDRHGGRIAAENPGKGTRMCVILPR